MDTQNMGYTGDNGGGYDQTYDQDPNASENYQLEEQSQNDGGAGYAQPPMGNPHATTAGSLFRSEEMALCQLFLQVLLPLEL